MLKAKKRAQRAKVEPAPWHHPELLVIDLPPKEALRRLLRPAKKTSRKLRTP